MIWVCYQYGKRSLITQKKSDFISIISPIHKESQVYTLCLMFDIINCEYFDGKEMLRHSGNQDDVNVYLFILFFFKLYCSIPCT